MLTIFTKFSMWYTWYTEKPLIHGWLSMTEAPANGACFLQNASARKAMVKGMISGPPSCEARGHAGHAGVVVGGETAEIL